MITIKYELYYSDYNFSHRVENIKDFETLKRWILERMHVKNLIKWINFNYDPIYISFQPEGPGMTIHIHQIEDEDGILYSDGEYTNNQSHIADCVKNWMISFKQELNAQTFNFINK